MVWFGKTWDIYTDIPDLKGKIAIVTGGNVGIGFEIVKALAIRGAKVYLAGRSEERVKTAIRKLESSYDAIKQNQRVIWLPLDLTHPEDAVKAAQQFLQQEDRLDILICNAARLIVGYDETDYGIEQSVAINHVGHFAFVQTLLPVLKSTSMRPGADVRIAIMSSLAHAMCPEIQHLRTKQDLNEPWPGCSKAESTMGRMKRYGFSKLLNELFKIELQRRLDQDAPSIIVLSMHPGNVNTENAAAGLPSIARPLFQAFASAPELGAKSALIAATAPAVRDEAYAYKASYIYPNGKRHAVAPQALSKTLSAELWALTQIIVDEELQKKSGNSKAGKTQ